MIVGIGIDLVDTRRVKKLISRYGDRFLQKVFLPSEIQHCRRRKTWHLSFAARIAAKEAGCKALGTGWRRGVHWKCFEVVHEPSGKPVLLIHGRAREIATSMGVERIYISLSHDSEYATAHVVMESDESMGQ